MSSMPAPNPLIETSASAAPQPRYGWWLLALTVAMFYASLLPFDFAPTSHTSLAFLSLANLGWPVPGIEDVLVNLVLYIPVGVIVYMATTVGMATTGSTRAPGRGATGGLPASVMLDTSGRKPHSPCRVRPGCTSSVVRRSTQSQHLRGLAYAIIIALAMTLLIETLQAGVQSRVASWFDVGLNVTGCAAGAIGTMLFRRPLALAARAMVRTIAMRPWTCFCGMATAYLIVHHVAPFDFVTNTAGLWQTLSEIHWSVLEGLESIGVGDLIPFWANELAGALWFSILGVGLVGAAYESRVPSTHPRAAAISAGLTLIAVIGCLQMLTASHVLQPGRMSVWAVALGFGVLRAGTWLGNTHRRIAAAPSNDAVTPPRLRELVAPAPPSGIPIAMLVVLGAAQIVTILLTASRSATDHAAGVLANVFAGVGGSGLEGMAQSPFKRLSPLEQLWPLEGWWRAGATDLASEVIVGLTPYLALSVILLAISHRAAQALRVRSAVRSERSSRFKGATIAALPVRAMQRPGLVVLLPLAAMVLLPVTVMVLAQLTRSPGAYQFLDPTPAIAVGVQAYLVYAAYRRWIASPPQPA